MLWTIQLRYMLALWTRLTGGARIDRDHQAFAWNPSIAGTKSEDTVLITHSGAEVLTQTPDLPVLESDSIERPDILIR